MDSKSATAIIEVKVSSFIGTHVRPNDSKLSYCGGRRSLCGKAAGAKVGGREHRLLTPGAVRCSAWFGDGCSEWTSKLEFIFGPRLERDATPGAWIPLRVEVG